MGKFSLELVGGGAVIALFLGEVAGQLVGASLLAAQLLCGLFGIGLSCAGAFGFFGGMRPALLLQGGVALGLGDAVAPAIASAFQGVEAGVQEGNRDQCADHQAQELHRPVSHSSRSATRRLTRPLSFCPLA
ncbi:hypothetical protein D3C84_598900 [compost metagenome]